MEGGQGINELARRLGFSRGTCHRLIETLRLERCVERRADGRYRLASGMLAFVSGLEKDAWVSDIAEPLMRTLTEQWMWPVSLARPADGAMTVLATTDEISPLTRVTVKAGLTVPWTASAAGNLFLAYCDPDQRLRIEEATEGEISIDPSFADRLRRQGYHLMLWRQKVLTIAVPIFRARKIYACLSMRVYSTSLSHQAIVARYYDALDASAREISAALDRLLEDERPTLPV